MCFVWLRGGLEVRDDTHQGTTCTRLFAWKACQCPIDVITLSGAARMRLRCRENAKTIDRNSTDRALELTAASGVGKAMPKKNWWAN